MRYFYLLFQLLFIVLLVSCSDKASEESRKELAEEAPLYLEHMGLPSLEQRPNHANAADVKKPDEYTDTSAGVEKPDDSADTGRYQRLC